jgi:RimJ/RimL family protein N-acetyltransferase
MVHARVDRVSERLRYRRLRTQDMDVFHALVVDPHVRRYLMDGEVHDREFCLAALRISDRLFERNGVGMYLIDVRDGPESIGFAGLHVIESQGPEPQLIYAFVEGATGRGYATEAGRSMVEAARHAGLLPLLAGADAPNVASLRVLRKLGFREGYREHGAFGEVIMGRIA